MTFSDETLMAYADGELDAGTRRAVEDAMRNDPDIEERVARHRAVRAELGAAFSGVLDEPIPGRLHDAANAAPEGRVVTNLAGARKAQQAAGSRRRWSWPEWTAIAASVLVGVFVGRAALQAPAANLVAMSDGRIIAGGSLANALTNQAGGAQPQPSGIAIVATFRSMSGDYCRAFTSSTREVVAGLACRDADEWRVHTLSRGDPTKSGDAYRMAGAALPSPVVQAIESTIEGDALDLQQEDAARERGWRD